jgi:hypothetical protein
MLDQGLLDGLGDGRTDGSSVHDWLGGHDGLGHHWLRSDSRLLSHHWLTSWVLSVGGRRRCGRRRGVGVDEGAISLVGSRLLDGGLLGDLLRLLCDGLLLLLLLLLLWLSIDEGLLSSRLNVNVIGATATS